MYGYCPMTASPLHTLADRAEARNRVHLASAAAQPAIGPRHPVIRTGERPEIDPLVRIAVYSRDGNTCRACRRWVGLETKNLDHILPWSAGGPDTSTNLRLLCPPCNDERSNYRDGAPPAQPVTWWCTDCWSPQSRRTASWTNKIGTPGWREAIPLIQPGEHDLVLAFCAFCGLAGYTPSGRCM